MPESDSAWTHVIISQLVKTFTTLSVIIKNSVKHYGAAPGHSLPSVINPEINQLRYVALTGEHYSSMY